MEQMARNGTMEDSGFLNNRRYLLHDRDRKYCQGFRDVVREGDIEPIALPARSPNLNAYAERLVRSVKEECLSKLILLGEGSLRRVLRHYETHYHEERNHQGKQLPIKTDPEPITILVRVVQSANDFFDHTGFNGRFAISSPSGHANCQFC